MRLSAALMFASTAMLLALAAVASDAVAGDACKNVTFKFTNSHQEGHDGDGSDAFVTQPYAPAYPKCTRDKQYGPIAVYG